MADSARTIFERFLRIMSKAQRAQQKPRDYGTGEAMHTSEVHAIMWIAGLSPATVTGLAERAGVTKGAASQVVSKLERKGYLTKQVDPAQRNRILLHLTEKGRRVESGHEAFHRDIDAPFIQYLQNMNSDEMAAVTRFLDELEKSVDQKS